MSTGGPIATIDIGTNTTLLLVARPGKGGETEVLDQQAEITRLGRGIGTDAKLGAEGIARTLEVLRRYAVIAGRHGAPIAAIGTEALRRAPNAAEFLVPAAAILGGPVELTFRSVAESFPAEVASGRVAMVDLGGGSTEVIVSERGAVRFRHSFPVGSVRLHERHIHHDPAAPAEIAAVERDVSVTLEEARRELQRAPLQLLVGVAGTVTSLAAMSMDLSTYDPARVHGSRLGAVALDQQIARLSGATQPERERMAGLDPRRADVILAGALLLREIVRMARIPEVRVSDRGIRWGLFFERVAAASG
jgi:exopolyphosphatase/guanosine-5'-triphosphate,3'-diphosphate pyrophosphatase